MDGEARLLTTAETLELLLAEAGAERGAVDQGAPDPCPWVGGTTQWLRDMARRGEHPLPMAAPGQRGKSALFDPEAVREWFAEEFERRLADTGTPVLAGETTGILLTASMLAREIAIHPQTLARRLREYHVQPARVAGTHTYYRLGDMLAALTAAQRVEDPDSLPPTDRDAHWRAEARKDDVMKARRELVLTREAVAVVNALATLLRDAVDLIPDALESRCRLPAEALETVELEMDAVRRQIAIRVRELQEQMQPSRIPVLLASEEPAPEPQVP
jgi:hypothetical protein